MAVRHLIRWFALSGALALAGLIGCATAPSSAPLAPVATPSSFPIEQIRRGRALAAAGDCAGCHTARGGKAYAGGVPVPTPFGAVHGTNITPDRDTGIGAWSLDAFRRALRQGVSRDGHLLYPAFPYDHFTHLTDDDIAALYAFLMTRDAVHAEAPANHLVFPFNLRPLIAVWNSMYLHEGPVAPEPDRPPQYNRGLYLVEALAHCSSCHTPRNHLGAEKRDAYLDGGEVDGWLATPLNHHSYSPVPWDAASLAQYLRTGLVPERAITSGPMRGVVRNLAQADPDDVAAIATYIVAQMEPMDAVRRAREAESRRRAQVPLASLAANANDPGRTLYQGSCADCHDAGRGLSSDTALQLPLAIALHLPDSRNLVHIVRDGIEEQSGRWMPGFAGNLSDAEIASLVNWLRRHATDEAAWTPEKR